MPSRFTLGRQAARQVQRAVRKSERGNSLTVPPHVTTTQATCHLGKTDSSGVSALSGTDAGTGTVTLYGIDSGGVISVRTSTDGDEVTVKAYNVASSAVAASTWIMLMQISSGQYVVVFEDCG